MHNFFAPFCQVVIRNKDGREWIFDTAHYPFVSGVSVTQCIGGTHDGLTISIDAPYEDGKRMIDEGAFGHVNLVMCRLGYLGGTKANISPWYYGFLSNGGDGLELSPDGLTGSLSAKYDNRSLHYVKTGREAGSAGKDVSRLLDETAKELGFVVEMLGNSASKFLALSEDLNASKTRWIAVLGKPSRWDIIKECVSWSGCSFTIGSKVVPENGSQKLQPTIYVHSPDSQTEVPKRSYVMRGAPDFERNQFPIYTINMSGGKALWTGLGDRWDEDKPDPATGGVVSANIDLDSTGNVKEIPKVTPEKLPYALHENAAAIAPAPESRKIDDNPYDIEVSTPEYYSQPMSSGKSGEREAEAKSVNKMTRAYENIAVKGTISTIGVPLEIPNSQIQVWGCSRWDGPYQVLKVTHSYSPGNFETSLEIQRWGTTLKMNTGDTKTDGGVMPREQ